MLSKLMLAVGFGFVVGLAPMTAYSEQKAPVQAPVQAPVEKAIQAPVPVQAPVAKAVQAPVPVQAPIQAPAGKYVAYEDHCSSYGCGRRHHRHHHWGCRRGCRARGCCY